MISEFIYYTSKHRILIPLFVIGWIVNLSLVLPINMHLGHDTFWHMSLISVAFDSFPFQVPIHIGTQLQGYNYLLDYILYLISLTGISVLVTYLIIAPLVYLSFLTVLSVIFAKRFFASMHYVASFLFFTFLASPFSYLLSYFHKGTLFDGYSFPTTMQSTTALSNMAYAATIPLLLGVLIIMLNKKISIKHTVILSILVAVSFGFKFYGGVVVGFLVFIYFLITLIQTRNIAKFILYGFIVAVPSIVTVIFFYDPFSSSQTGSIFSFYPLSIVHPLIEDPKGIYFPNLVLARYYLIEAGGFSPRLFAIELFTVFLYVVYNAGTRIIGFISIASKILKRKMSLFELSVCITIVFSGTMSVLFIQKGGDWWNTVQFFGYALFFLNIFAATTLDLLLKKKTIASIIFAVCIVILTLPLNIELVWKSIHLVGKSNGMSENEVAALAFLKDQEEGIIFTIPVTYTSSYVSALAQKPVYFADENMLTNIGIDYEPRKKELMNLEEIDYKTLDIDYIYYLKYPEMEQAYSAIVILNELARHQYKEIYSNEEVIVYKK